MKTVQICQFFLYVNFKPNTPSLDERGFPVQLSAFFPTAWRKTITYFRSTLLHALSFSFFD
jgi:hypothetical protein